MRFLAILLLVPALLLPACGGGSSNPIAVIGGLLGTAGCTANGIEDYDLVLDALEAALQVSPVPSVLDVDTGSGASRVQISGTISELGGDLSDGFSVGDSAQLVITSATVGTSVSGNGNLTANFAAPTSITIVGNFGFTDSSCSADFTNANLDFDPTDPDGYPIGTVDFQSSVQGDTLSGTITFTGTSTANVIASLNAGTQINFTIDLDDYAAALP